MFKVLIVKPIFNLLVLIYALLPGHNFGLAIIIFTIVVRLLMWPLVRRQLRQTKAMRDLQPELKRIKAATKGDKQKESLMMMELYKERKINPFSSFGTLIVQFVILIGLYSGLRLVVKNPQAIIDYSYPWLHSIGWMKTLAADISQFDNTLFGFIDLSKSALNSWGVYWPAMGLVLASAAAQYYQSKQLLPNSQDNRSLRQILKDAANGKQADSAETNAAVGRSMRFLIPGMIIFISLRLPAAISLYWLVGGLVAYWQQARVLNQDTTDMKAMADTGGKEIIEGEVIPPKNRNTKKKSSAKRKRKKR